MMNRRPRNNRGNQPRRSGGGGGSNRMQVFDSNGPDVRIRGTAWQVHEKYMALAKDAGSAGDRILAENYLQHAEHYQRLINSWALEDDFRPQPPQSAESDPGEGDQPAFRNEGNSDASNDGGAERPAREGFDPSRRRRHPYQQRAPHAHSSAGRGAAPSGGGSEDLGLPASILGNRAASAPAAVERSISEVSDREMV